jgi:hemin uptake protein HemP
MNDKRVPGSAATPASPAPRRRLESSALLGRDTELIIAHGGEEYRLRLTRQGKLILTK